MCELRDRIAERVARDVLEEFVRSGRWYPDRMRVDFEVGDWIDARCASCGRERELLVGGATRVLEGDVLYADMKTPCSCGAARIRVNVKVSDAEEEHPRSGQATDRDRR